MKLFSSILILILVMLDTACSRSYPEDLKVPGHFVGRTVSDIKKELGDPVNSEGITNGQERLHFLDHSGERASTSKQSPALEIMAWDIVVEKDVVVAASPIYGINSLGKNDATKTSFVVQLMTVTEKEESGAERVAIPSSDGKSYYISPSSNLFAVSIENLRLSIDSSEQRIIKLNGRVAASGADSLRAFISKSVGQVTLFAINNEPIATIRILDQLPSEGEFEVRFPVTTEVRVALKKLGLMPPE